MKFYKLLSIVATIALAIMISSCGGSKPVASNQGDVEIALPFSSKEYRTDKEFFRATAQGVSSDMTAAKKIANLNARNQLAGDISTVVKAVTEQYMSQVNIAGKEEFQSKFEETTRTVIDRELTQITVKDEKVFKSKEGKYTYHIAIEMPKAAIEQSVIETISKDEKTNLEFDKYMFQKTFDAEMAKLENK